MKFYDKNCITLDGRMDEPVWDQVKEYTNFKHKLMLGGRLADAQTSFKIIPCEDRIYVGVKCYEPNMAYVKRVNPQLAIWVCDHIELFFSPNCNYYDFYQFVVTFEGKSTQYFYSEGGNIKPDPYAPEWNYAIYKGDDFWSVEIELPLTAFYMTGDNVWNDTWLVNTSRMRTFYKDNAHSRNVTSWCELERTGLESQRFQPISGFPMRPAKNDLRMLQASVEITGQTDAGYVGELSVKVECPENATFEFTSDCVQPIVVDLKEGVNEFTAPCTFSECKRYSLPLQLKRLEDGVVFKRYYPVRISYEAIRLELTKPQYRGNFYPGQDYSEVSGKVVTAKLATLKLEGPGIETQIITPDADGSFVFATPNFAEGEALLTITTEDHELVKKIRRLAPVDNMMTWIEDGKFIVNGEARFTCTVSAEEWKGGEAFKKKYYSDNLYISRDIKLQLDHLEADRTLKKHGMPTSETTQDIRPSQVVFDKIDEQIELNKGRDFAYYYLSDEPECRGISPVYLKHLYDHIIEKDPYHIVRIASRAVDHYVDAADFFEVHPYINPYTDDDGKRVYSRPFETIGKYVDDLTKLNRKDKSIGFYGTAFGAIKAKKDPYPNFDEMICTCWSGLVRGAKTYRVYAYHDLNDRPSVYEGTRYTFSSTQALADFLTHAKLTTLMKNKEVECALYELGDEKMFVLVNFTQEPKTVTLDELAGTWYNFRNNSTISGPTFQLKPIQVVIGTTCERGADLPTYQQTKELIDKLEYERCNRGNLLFERRKDITITSSAPIGWTRKLFDGTLDNYAWDQSGEGEKFIELDLQKIKPTFNKIVVHGYHIDTMELKLRNGEEWTVADAEISNEEYVKTYKFSQPVSADAVRMEFDARKVELYEFEMFNN